MNMKLQKKTLKKTVTKLNFSNLINFKKSFNIRGVDIDKKKKCHVHNGQADLRLFEEKNIIFVIIEYLVNFEILFENKKNNANRFK